jgi:hypothetical protein
MSLDRIADALEGILAKLSHIGGEVAPAPKPVAPPAPPAPPGKPVLPGKPVPTPVPKNVPDATESLSDALLQEVSFDTYTRIGENRQPIDDLMEEFGVKDTSQLGQDKRAEFITRLGAL